MIEGLCQCCEDSDIVDPAPATKLDNEGVPLCDACYKALSFETYVLEHPEEFE